jgi:hypothetical protein
MLQTLENLPRQSFFGYICIMKSARILLAFTMLLAIVFRSLPDSVFDHFHQHEHTTADSKHGNAVSNYKHNCHIEDWNFESFEVTESHYTSYQPIEVSALLVNEAKGGTISIINLTGRAPPLA